MIEPTKPGAELFRRKAASLGDQSSWLQAAASSPERQRVVTSESGVRVEEESVWRGLRKEGRAVVVVLRM